MTSMFICNFRRRVMNYLIKNSSHEDLTLDTASNLIAKKVDASREFVTDLDDPIVRTNFSNLLRKVMASNDTTWKAISMLAETKQRMPGFDYNVWTDDDGYPIGILWMTPTMKSNIVRFSHILYLDMQLRQYNSIGWPYCGVSMRNHENETVVGAETIIVEESNASYQWILQTCADLEPRFQLSSIRLIFADQKITKILLTNLSISDSCSLHGDWWHLLNDVWPKLFKPAHHYFDKIKDSLTTMLDSRTVEEWRNAFEVAKSLIQHNGDMYDNLVKIFKNPEYYAGFYRKQIEGNRGSQGDTPAEQNHSSIDAHLGKGATWDICEHISRLLGRQQLHAKQRSEREAIFWYKLDTFEPSTFLSKNEQDNDKKARLCLSNYAYKALWNDKVLSRSKKFNSSINNANNMVTVWLKKYDTPNHELAQSVTYVKDQRCNCQFRIDYMFMCAHEYSVDKTFNSTKIASIWYHRRKYNEEKNFNVISDDADISSDEDENVLLSSLDPRKKPSTTTNDSNDQENNFELDNDVDDNTDVAAHVPETHNNASQPTYSSIIEKCKTLCVLLQNSPTELKKFDSTIVEMTDRYRKQMDVIIRFDDVYSSYTTNNSKTPLLGKVKAFSNATKIGRLKSRKEKNMTSQMNNRKLKHGRQPSSFNNASEDVIHARIGYIKTRSCLLCKGSGHVTMKCPNVLKYGVPLPKGDSKIREMLCETFDDPTYGCVTIPPTHTNNLYDDIPKKHIQVLIIHKKVVIASKLTNNQYLEITLLHQSATEHEDYTKVLVRKNAIAKWIQKSKNNVVVSLLEKIDNAYISLNQQQHTDDDVSHFFNQPQSMKMIGTQLASQDPDGLHENQLTTM